MTLEEYINKHGSSYPATQIAFQDFCDIIESGDYHQGSLTQDLPIAKLINYANANSNDDVDLNELLNSSIDGMRLFAEYCSENPDYKGDRTPLLSPNLGVDIVKGIRKKLVPYYEKIHNYERQPSIVKDRWAGFKISDKSRSGMSEIEKYRKGIK
jgi:hypothetical protein